MLVVVVVVVWCVRSFETLKRLIDVHRSGVPLRCGYAVCR
jgi:hypothetical protein